MTRTYNPLSVDELGRNAVRALMDYPCEALPPSDRFPGAGVYTIHYHGRFPAYQEIPEGAPIYVGKADPPGKRQGAANRQTDEPALHGRLRQHANTISQAENLDPGDFCCRWLLLAPVWIELTEQVLIDQYRPVWNVIVDGFGIHAPGKGRGRQARSRWDTLHPGRDFANLLPDRDENTEAIVSAIADHLRREISS